MTIIHEVTNLQTRSVYASFASEGEAQDLIDRNIDCGGWDCDWEVVPRTVFGTVEEFDEAVHGVR